MAVQKNTNDLLTQASTTLPDNTTQDISPADVREMAENTAVSSFNKITDSALVGLKEYSTLVTYESGQGCVSSGKVYISNKITGPGAFVSADWDIYDNLTPSDKAKIDFLTITQTVDLDTMESDVATNNGKVTNATHTGEVTGSGTLTVNPTAISNKTALGVLAGTEEFLINDGGTLKKVLASNLGGSNLYTADGTLTGVRTVTMGGNSLTFEGATTIFKGSGSTSATTALLVQNSLSTNLLEVLDNGHLTVNGTPRVNNFVKFHAIGFGGKTPLSDATFNFRDWVFENNSNCLMSIVGNGSSSLEFIPTTTADSATIRASSTGLHIAASGGVYRYSYHKTKGHWFGDSSINQGANFDTGVQWVFAPSGIGDMQLYAPDATALGTFNSPKLRLRASGYDTTTNTNEIKLQNITDTAGNYKLEVQDTANAALLTLLGNTGDLGIGLTPTAKLHVQGSGSTSATTALLVQNSLSTNLLEVLDDGTVGIGTTPVANQPLTVTAADRYAFVSSGNFNNSGSISGASLTSTSTTTNNIIGLELNSATNTSWLGTTNNSVSASFSGLDNATLIFNNGTSGKGINLVANTASGVIRMMTGGNNERVIVDNAGNVGIGVTNPTVKLAVDGDSHINGKLAINGTTFATDNHVTIDSVSEPFAIGASSSWNNFGSIGGIRLETTSAAVNNGIGISLSSNTNNNTLLGNTGANVTGGFTGLESSYLVYNSGTNSKGINLVSRGTNASIKLRSTTTTSGEAPVSLLIDSSGGVQINNNLGLFGTTPIAQPTTAGASAVLGTTAGTGLTDTDTFDGYTLQQVVKALRNLGILA